MIKQKLYDEIGNEIDKLSTMEVGSEQRSQAVKELTSLLDRAIEIEKFKKMLKTKMQLEQSRMILKCSNFLKIRKIDIFGMG